MKKLLQSAGRIAAGVGVWYLLMVAGMVVMQDRFVFLPQPPDDIDFAALRNDQESIEDITLRTPDGVELRGWFVKKKGIPKAPLVLYYVGNADEASTFLHTTTWMEGWSVALLNYRGFGRSGGKPSEKAIYADALQAFDFFTGRDDVDRSRVVLFGRSLGTGVATYVARHRPVSGVILASPYDSIASIGQKTFPYLPVKLVLRNRFDAAALAPSVKAPLLACIAANDTTVAPWHSYRLVERWGGPRTVVVVADSTHNSMLYTATYWKNICDFLASIAAGTPAHP